MTKINNLFVSSSSLIKIDLSNFNSETITDMHEMFSGCESLSYINLSNFKAKNVTNMSGLFSGCQNLIFVKLSNFNTEKVKDMSWMFSECRSLAFLDVSSFNTKNVEDMRGMFYGCSSLLSLYLSNFNTRNVTNMHQIFFGCQSLTSIDLSSFNDEQLTDLSNIFYQCKSLTSIKLSNSKTLNVSEIDSMLTSCDSLKPQDLFLTDGISCLSFNKDFTKVALSKKDNVIYIYSIPNLMKTDTWKLEDKLEKHILYVSGIDWNWNTNQILSCSYDKTSFVWTYSNKKWDPSIVVFTTKLGFLCCKWNDRGDKFCEGTSAKHLIIGFYSTKSNWWKGRNIKMHKIGVVCCAIDPTSLFVLSGSTDLRVYVCSCYIPEVDDRYLNSTTKCLAQEFGKAIYEFRLNCWIDSVAWNKSGELGFAAGQNATIVVINYKDQKSQLIKCKHSPVTLIVPTGDNSFLAVCYDRNIFEYEKKGDKWEVKRAITNSKQSSHLHKSLITSLNIIGRDVVTTDLSGFIKYWKL
jgi:surface protein